jgi:hypothetical protein
LEEVAGSKSPDPLTFRSRAEGLIGVLAAAFLYFSIPLVKGRKYGMNSWR